MFAYDLLRIEEQARSLEGAFERRGVPFRLRLALKAQREPEVLAFVRGLRSVGLDVCSPGEARHGLEHGWAAREMSFTGTNLSERDLDALLEIGVHVNLDLLSQLDRWGRRSPGSSVGIRVNPRAGAAWAGASAEGRRGADREAGESLYAGTRATKFGILPEQLDDAIEIAAKHELAIDTVHFHVGDGFLTDGLAHFEVARRVGGGDRPAPRGGRASHRRGERRRAGSGCPQAPGERPLDVDAYADVLVRHLGGLGATIACEPGDFLCKDSAVLLAEVVTLDDRDGATFAGLDAGLQRGPRALHLRLRRPDRALPRGGRRTRTPLHRVREHQRGRRPLGRGGGAARAARGRPGGPPRRRQLQPVDASRPLPASSGRHGRVRGSDLTAGPRKGAARRAAPFLPCRGEASDDAVHSGGSSP